MTGPVTAATLAAQMHKSFPNLLFGLMVGVRAGCPGKELDPDIRLGDVVIGTPNKNKATLGVIGYDLGRELETEFTMYGTPLANTGRLLRNTFGKISTELRGSGKSFVQFLRVDKERKDAYEALFSRPNVEDNLYNARHQLISRQPRNTQSHVDHYGPIASGSKVIRNPSLRGKFRDEHGIFCFEMEAAG